MNKRTFLVSLLVTVVAIVFASQAPSFTFETIQGETIRSDALLEKGPIFLNFWSTSCVPCKNKLPHVSSFAEKYPDMSFLAISTDSPRHRDAVVRLVRSNRYNFTTSIDANRSLQRMFNVSTIPRSVIIDQEGQIVYDSTGYIAGDEEKIEAEIKAVLGVTQ